MIKISFIKDSLLYTIGNALPMIASIILLPFYANYLNSENYVALSFYIGISLLYQIIFSFSFEQYYGVIYTEIKHNNEDVKILNGSILIYLLLYGLMIIITTSLIGQNILSVIFQEKIPMIFFPYGLLSVLTGFFNAIFKVMMSTYIYAQKPKIFFLSNVTNFIATIIISLGGLFLFPDTLIGPIYGRFLSGIIIVLFNYVYLKHIIVWKLEMKYIKEFIQKSWALFAYAILMWITGNIDRYFLKNYVDVQNLAGYDLIMKCFIGIEFIQNGLSMAIVSKIFDIWKNDNRITFTSEANRYFNIFSLLSTGAIAVFVFVLPFFIQIIIPKPIYYTSFQYIGLIAAGYIIRNLIYPYYFAFLYSKKTLNMFLYNATAILLQVVLSYIFIPLYGLIAAIFIGIFIKTVPIIIYHLNIKHITDVIKINYLKWFGLSLIIALIYILMYLYHSQSYTINYFISGIFYIFISILIYKNEIPQMLALLKKK